MEQLMTVKDVAYALKKAVKTVYHYVESESIPPDIILRFGNGIRIKRPDFEKWLEGHRGA
jgi:excisionase family DNA binding protein